MIEINNLSKYFGQFCAVDNLSFTIKKGEVVGFLGPNGAGKSTTMKMLTGFLPASTGSIEIAGLDIAKDNLAIRKILGYLPEGAPAYDDMTVWQFLNFIADIRGLTAQNKQLSLAKVITDVELEAVLDKPIETLSKGFKRRVGLAQAILHDPKVLILDEPTDGLDPNQKHQVRQLIQNLAQDKIVIVSTHILEEVTAVCNRAIIIAQGRKIFDGTPQQLQAMSCHHHSVTIELSQFVADIEPLQQLEQVERVETKAGRIHVTPKQGQAIFEAVFQTVQQLNWPVKAIYHEQGRLDDVFRQLTQQSNKQV